MLFIVIFQSECHKEYETRIQQLETENMEKLQQIEDLQTQLRMLQQV